MSDRSADVAIFNRWNRAGFGEEKKQTVTVIIFTLEQHHTSAEYYETDTR